MIYSVAIASHFTVSTRIQTIIKQFRSEKCGVNRVISIFFSSMMSCRDTLKVSTKEDSLISWYVKTILRRYRCRMPIIPLQWAIFYFGIAAIHKRAKVFFTTFLNQRQHIQSHSWSYLRLHSAWDFRSDTERPISYWMISKI